MTPRTLDSLVPLKDCIKGRVYRLCCRNLAYGVFDGKDGFVGIRTKFGSRFLFTEYHWEQGEPYGTVSGAVDLSIDVPPGIVIGAYQGVVDKTTGRQLRWDDDLDNPHDIAQGRKGWWRYDDTGDAVPTIDAGCKATSVPNLELFRFLEKIETEHGVPDDSPHGWLQSRPGNPK